MPAVWLQTHQPIKSKGGQHTVKCLGLFFSSFQVFCFSTSSPLLELVGTDLLALKMGQGWRKNQGLLQHRKFWTTRLLSWDGNKQQNGFHGGAKEYLQQISTIFLIFFSFYFFFFFVKSYSKKESSLSGFQLFTYCVLRFSNPLLNDRISNNLFRSSIIKPFLFKSNRDYECVSQLRVEQTAATSKKIHQV